jgi:hypothetical protein
MYAALHRSWAYVRHLNGYEASVLARQEFDGYQASVTAACSSLRYQVSESAEGEERPNGYNASVLAGVHRIQRLRVGRSSSDTTPPCWQEFIGYNASVLASTLSHGYDASVPAWRKHATFRQIRALCAG